MNDVMMHAGVHGAPFGGVGESGYGYYHGRHGLDAFTHTRTVVTPPLWLEKLMSFRYPPFNSKHIAKIAVTNKLGFKKGEGLKDQKIKTVGRKTSWLKVFCVAIACCWLIDAKFLGRQLYIAEIVRKAAISICERL